jgi:hypothetical protein
MQWACDQVLATDAELSREKAAMTALPRLLTCQLRKTDGTVSSQCCDSDDEGGRSEVVSSPSSEDVELPLPDKVEASQKSDVDTDVEQGKSWHTEALPNMLQPSMECAASVNLVHHQQIASSSQMTSACECQGCAGGGIGTFCCCQQPESTLWSCEYLMFESLEGGGRSFANPVEHSLPWLLTCPLCPSPADAPTEQQCCTSAVDHLKAIQGKFAWSPYRSLHPFPLVAMFAALLAMVFLAVTAPLVRRVVVCHHGGVGGMPEEPLGGHVGSDEESLLRR